MNRLFLSLLTLMTASSAALAGHTNNIMLTGYWPPTNDMIRPFSTDSDLNPEGWVGENWEGRGYDVYSFFPEFDSFPADRVGSGDFTVDYQDTSEDFYLGLCEIEKNLTYFNSSDIIDSYKSYSWENIVLNNLRKYFMSLIRK